MGHLLSKAQSVGGRGRDRVQRDLKRRKIQGDAKRDFGQDPNAFALELIGADQLDKMASLFVPEGQALPQSYAVGLLFSMLIGSNLTTTTLANSAEKKEMVFQALELMCPGATRVEAWDWVERLFKIGKILKNGWYVTYVQVVLRTSSPRRTNQRILDQYRSQNIFKAYVESVLLKGKAPPAEAVSRICEVYQVIFFCLEIRKRTDKFLRLCDAKFAEAELREADLMVEVLKKETEMLVRKDADEEDSKRATAALRGFRA